jgi:SAM-dependent MidA family methyltransferase
MLFIIGLLKVIIRICIIIMMQTEQTLQSFVVSAEGMKIQEALIQRIVDKISKKDNKISFADFMRMALYEPKLGYYQNNLHKFGEKGDFITAPEMGENFSQCLAESVDGYFQEIVNDQNKVVLEVGAGSGVLGVNLLLALKERNILPDQYYILEPSAALKNEQKTLLKEALPEYFNNIQWLNQLPEKLNGIIIANEVIDAIPCERVIKEDDCWHQLGVTQVDEKLQELRLKKIDNQQLPKPLIQNEIEDGYITEYRPLVKGWINALSNSLESGAILLIDYGYGEEELYHPQRNQGTLTCFINHHSHSDPLNYVGLQDITAHVDFTQVARVAHAAGLTIEGFTTQAGFLLENGITEINEENSKSDTPEQRVNRSRELQQLLMPGQMGEVIKVICLGKNLSTEIKGFTLQDHLHRL